MKKVYVGLAADIFHSGHINIIKTAKKYGKVIIGLLTDKAIKTYKRKPFMTYKQRYELVINIKGVEKVIPQYSLDYSKNLIKVKPNYVVHGDDWKRGVQKNTRHKVLESLSQWGGKLIEVPYTKSISTSKLLTKFKNDNTLFHKKEWSFNLNSKIVFKKKIDAILKKNLGKGNLLIVTSNSFRKNKIVKVIEKSKNNIFIFSSVKPNPTIEEIDHLSETYKSKNIKTIIALGGGSVLDTAKTLSIIINNPNKKLLNDFFRKKKKFKFTTKTKLIAIPTTSGSGAEVTPFATIWDKKNLYKYSFSLDNIVPNLVLLEPQLQVSQKKDLTLYSALDTISHSLESLWNKNKTIISESFAFESLLLSNSSLLKAMNNPKNIEARSKLLIASNIAGLAISQTRTAIAHSISYPITLNFNVPHGLACSFTLATLLKKNMEGISRNTSDKFLLENILFLLENINLKKHMLNYCSKEKIQKIKNQMLNKSRSDNYIDKLKIKDVEKILNESL